jgi:adenylosuccinate lyase
VLLLSINTLQNKEKAMSQQDYTEYDNPLSRRYASPAMRRIFSPQFKFGTWRRLWIALAESQRELGLAVTDEQLAAMRAVAEQIDFAAAEARERACRAADVLPPPVFRRPRGFRFRVRR